MKEEKELQRKWLAEFDKKINWEIQLGKERDKMYHKDHWCALAVK